MSIYAFKNANSPIDRVTIRHTEGGGTRAYLHARDNANPAELDKIKKLLTSHSLPWTPIQEDTIPTLEVRGIGKDDTKFLRLLDESDALTGGYKKLPTPDDRVSLKDKLSKNTLSASGAAYFVGDMSYLKYTWNDSHNRAGKMVKPESLMGGIFYALGTPFIMLFGRGDKSDLQFKHMSYNMIHDLEKEKLSVPQDSAIRAVAHGHNKNAWRKFKTFCERYPAEITNSIFAAAGSMILLEKGGELKTFKWKPAKLYKEGGMKAVKESFNTLAPTLPGQTPHKLSSVIMDIGLGSMTVLAGLISVFVEEEKRKPGEPKKKGLPRLWQMIKERPLAAASTALMVSTMAHAGSTAVDMRGAKKDLLLENRHLLNEEQLWEKQNLVKSLPFRGVFVGSNLAAEILMFFSSKGHGAGVISDKSLDNSAYAVAADLLHRTQKDKRPEMLDTLANFLADKKHLSREKSEVLDGINTQLQVIESNPWAVLPGQKMIQNEQTATPAESQDYWQKKTAIPSPAVINASKNHRDTLEASRENLTTLTKS